MRLKFSAAVLLAILAWAALAWAWPQPAWVLRVYDGDTYTVDLDGARLRVRLQGVDCPELADRRGRWAEQPGARQARDWVAARTADRYVLLEITGAGRYRVVGRVILPGGQDLATELVRAGWAWVDPRYSHDRVLLDLQAEARAARRGLWGLPGKPVPPWEWRKGRVR